MCFYREKVTTETLLMAKLSNVNSLLPKTSPSLNDRQRKLVDILISSDCSVSEAAKLAGYGGKTPGVQGYQTLKKPHVASYMYEQVKQSFGLSSIVASRKLLHLSQNANSEYVQMESAKDILDRAGHKAPDKHQHQIVGDFKVNIDLG